MRLLTFCMLFMAALWLAPVARGQSTPAYLPPPQAEGAAGDTVEAPSTVWQPPPGETYLPGSSSLAAESSAELSSDVVARPSPWYSPILWLGPAPWDSGIELGLNGSSGTSDSFSVHTGAYIQRESRFSRLDLRSGYNLTLDGGKSAQNNGHLDVCHDWLIDESSPWTLFAATGVFYDKFSAFDWQLNADTGVGYRLVHTPGLDLITRVGGGASREFGGPDDRWVPESLVGIEYCQRVTQTQKFYTKFDYFPEWDQVGEYRMVADAGWEIELVQPSNLSLKISATDRYDSTPNGADPQLLNYAVVLLLKL